VGLLLACAAAPSWAEEPEATGEPGVLQTKSGLHFRVPADWPIEERNGVVAPIPIEEYLTQKFATMDARIRMLEQQVSGYDLRLRVLEEANRSGGASRLRSGEGSP
jgi:hypothetical protein